MKKQMLSLLIGAICAGSAFAAESNVSKLGEWTVTGVTVFPNSDGAVPTDDGQRIAGTIVDVYRQAGYLTVEATVDESTKTIKINEAGANPTGVYADYFSQNQGMLTREQLELAVAKMGPAANFDGQAIDIEVQSVDPQTGNAEIRTSAKPIAGAKMAGGSVSYSNSGQRYSGPDVGSAYVYKALGDASQIDASIAHGFSNANTESKGGRFNAGSVSYRKATIYGLTSLQAAVTSYATGGETAALELSGDVSRYTLDHSYLYSKELTILGRLFYSKTDERMGATGWTDSQKYAAAFAGVRYQAQGWGADAGIEQGLTGSAENNFTPLLGAFNPHYHALTANANGSFDVGSVMTVVGKTGFQVSSTDTPSSAQFVMGGPDRGRSFATGFAAVPTGAYASVALNSSVYEGFQGYAGVDASQGRPVVGDDIRAASAFVGVRFAIGAASGDVGFAKSIGSQDLGLRDTKFNANLTFGF